MNKINQIKPGATPFVTSNAALAFALYSAGIPFADPRKPCRNIYSEEIVFRIGGGKKDGDGHVIKSSRYAGMPFEDAVNRAFSEDKKGHVEFLFDHPKGLTKLCAAFADQEREFKEKDIVGSVLLSDIMTKIANGTVSQQEGLLRLACVNLKMRPEFMDLWKKQVPMIKIDNRGKIVRRKTSVTVQTKDGPRKLPADGHFHPGFKIININLSEKKRKHIGL
jgi:hypothetical protein